MIDLRAYRSVPGLTPAEGERHTASRSWQNRDGHYISALSDPWYAAICEIQNAISVATFRFFCERGLRTLHLPITTASISSPMGLGSDSKPVSVDLLGTRTYLADSMQFMLEYGCRLHDRGCWYLMPSFRGEQADRTHLSQFYHAEAEIPGSLEDVMTLVEDYLRAMSTVVYESCGEAIRHICDPNHIERLIRSSGSLPRISLDDAITLLGEDPDLIDSHPLGFRTLTRAGECRLIEHFDGFVWLVNQDALSVPFYQASSDVPGKARAADLLFGVGEVVGAGERHATATSVRSSLDFHQVDPQPYEWYLRLRERYPMQTAGFGLGTERYICWLLNHQDVRDCQLLPRFYGESQSP
jgi:asparaginyl-tRNA synthetase